MRLTQSFESIVLIIRSTTIMGDRPTRQSIADAAESLFGERGFVGTSLRQITDKAGVNLAAVNYHFHSKEDLYRQVLFGRLRPINAERLALLAQAEQLAGDHPVPFRAVLDTFVRPWLRHASEPASGGILSLRLLSRELIDPQPFLQDELARELEPLMTRYTQVLGSSLPGVPPPELFWRLQFSLGTLLSMAVRWQDLHRVAFGPGAKSGGEDSVRRLIGFCAAGLEALRTSA